MKRRIHHDEPDAVAGGAQWLCACVVEVDTPADAYEDRAGRVVGGAAEDNGVRFYRISDIQEDETEVGPAKRPEKIPTHTTSHTLLGYQTASNSVTRISRGIGLVIVSLLVNH